LVVKLSNRAASLTPVRKPIVKKIGVLLALAYALTTGMAAATVVAHVDQALTKD
jgi:hypothetical protein